MTDNAMEQLPEIKGCPEEHDSFALICICIAWPEVTT